MDKSWINSDARHTKAYIQGVNSFLAFAFRNSAVGDKILCPCRKCVNSFWRDSSEIREHLICDGHVAARSTLNKATAPPSDIPRLHDGFENDTHVATEESLLPPRPVEAQLASNRAAAPTSHIPRLHDGMENDTHVATNESLLPPRPVAARSARNMTTASTNDILPHFANDTTHDAAHAPINKITATTNDVRRLHDDFVGKDVILYALLRSELAMARGTITSTNPHTIVGGQPLGNEFCEVVVNLVMKRDVVLPRPYDEMHTMGSALNMHIAWPLNKVRECRKKELKKASTPLKGTAGSAGNKSLA